MKKEIFLFLGALAAVAFIVLCVITLFVFFFRMPGGMSPTYPARNNDPVLTVEAATAKPLIAAIKNYLATNGKLPAHASDFAPLIKTKSGTPIPPVPAGSDDIDGWRYFQTNNGYDLSRRLGWDPSLMYTSHGTTTQWIFAPGDGSANRVIVLNP